MTATTPSGTATGAAARTGQPSMRQRLAERGIDRVLLLLLPGVVFLLLLFIYPFLYGLQLSFAPSRAACCRTTRRSSPTRTSATRF